MVRRAAGRRAVTGSGGRTRRVTLPAAWRDASDLLVAVIPLALTVLLLISGFTPVFRTLSTTTWTGFSYQAMLNKVLDYALATRTGGTPARTLARLHDQAEASLNNPLEFGELDTIEQIGAARLSRVAALFRAADQGTTPAIRQARLSQAVAEAEQLNEQVHEHIHDRQVLQLRQLERLRLALLLGAAMSGLLSAALIWRALRLWRTERQRLDGQRELLSLASHELRRPLQSLLLATDLLRSAQTPEERLRYLGVVESSAGQLASRANLEHLDTMYGEVHLDWQEVDLTALLLEFRGPRTDVQSRAPALRVPADPARLRQIVENLHENALRYSVGPVSVSLNVQDGQPRIQVRDRGPGIDPGDVERLFLPGERQRAEAGAPAQDGQGLGLTIARRLAQAHGAALTLESAPGGGTLAVLILPPLHEGSSRPELAASAPLTARGRPKRLR